MKILGGEYKDGVITVSLASAANMTAVAGHELGHYLAQNYAEEYKELSKYVQTALEAHGESIAARVLQVQALYERQTGQKLDYDEAVEEIVNNALFSVDIKSAEFETFIKEHTNLAQRILDAIHELLRDLSAFFKTATGIKEVETLRGDLEYMQEVADRVEEILQKNGNNLSKNTENFAESEQNVQNSQKNSTTAESGVRYSFVDKTDDGRSIYKTNYPKGTPKIKKQNDIINLVQNVWSKKPIALKIIENGKWKTINARFNPEFSSRSDLTKIAFGNRKGSASEQRMTLDLAGDLYLIAEESKYVKSKGETGKDFNRAHDNVDVWHYFVTNLVYRDENDNDIDCHMNIDVKHNNDGNWFYSFAIEKGTAPQTLLAVVTDESATVPTNSISDSSEKSNSKKLVLDRDYMQAARNGDEEKAAEYVEQAAERAFPNSTVRDDNGKLLKLYHGTPNAGFTVFKPESYFTPNKEYADVYQSPGASSNSVKTSADNPSTYAVYLNIEKPFDTRNAKERDIFYNEFYRQWGNGAPLAESGLPDWTDASDLLEFIEEKGYDYDGIILDEGGTGGYGDEVKSRGISYVPVNANQIKSANPVTYDDNGEIIPLSERFSDDKDIRYSVKDSEGEQLSNGQATYFSDSKVRDKDGNLLRVYHGTYADFTVFDPVKYGGQTGADHGKGIYFTSVPAIAASYGNSDKVYYLNITKPAFDNKVTLTKSEIEQLVRASAEYEAEKAVDYGDYDDFDEALQDSFVSVYGGTYSAAVEMLLKNNYNDVDIIYDIMNAIGANTDFESAIDYYNEVLTPSTGIDGFQTRFTHAGDDGMDKLPNVFIAFNSNQAKLTSNTAPTDNKDIRYLVYDTALTDTIREQEAELARAARESGAYKSAVNRRKTFGDKIALIRRQMNVTFKTPTYRYEKVAKVADDFLKKYGITDQLDESEKKAFITALHNMYRNIDGSYGLGYLDDKGKYQKPMENAAELADEYAAQAIGIIRDYMTVTGDDRADYDNFLQNIKETVNSRTVYLDETSWSTLQSHYDGSVAKANKDVPYARFARAKNAIAKKGGMGGLLMLEDLWVEARLNEYFDEYVDIDRFIDLLKSIKDGSAKRMNYFDQFDGTETAELMNEAILDLQNTWAQVMLENTFADNTVMSVEKAKEQDKKSGKKTNHNVAQLATYKTALKDYMKYAEKAVDDLQRAYAKENEQTLATLRALGAALAAERKSNEALKNDLGDAKAGERIAENKNRKLTKTVEELTKNNATLAAYVDSLTEEKKQALIDYAEANKKLRRAEKKVETREKWLEDFGFSEELLNRNTAQKNSTTAESGVRYMLLGTTADGIEVYETSEENKNKSYAEKLNIFAQSFITPGTDMYIGNSISYIDGNGNKKVAYIDRYTKNKNIGNINPGRLNQWDKAKINAGAEDDFVRISSNGKFSHNEPTRNTLKNDVHKKTNSFDYTIKTIWLDGRLYEINANIRNDKNGKSYVYFVDFTRKKEDPQRRHQLQLFMQRRPVAPKSARSSGTSTINVTQQNSKVKNNKTGSLFLFP